MRYMLLIYTNENAVQTPAEAQQVMAGHRSAMEEAARKGFLRGAEPLASTSTATTLRMQGGQVVLTDGPFAETKEQLAGYYILDCNNLDEAIEIARQVPTACGGGEGCVEIRPMRSQTSPDSGEAAGPAHG